MKKRTTFLKNLAAMIIIMAMVMPQYAAATITDNPPNIVIDANNNVTVNVDADNIGTGSFIVNDENGSLDTITTILSNAQSTVIGAGDANTITNSLTVAGTTTTNSGDFTVTGATTLSSTLSVTGNTSLSTLSTSGLATLDSASITNNATVGGTLGVTGATTLTGALTANGGATLNSADSYSSATIGNSAVTLVADSDALSTNAQSSLSMAPTSASLLVNTDTGDSHGITISQTSTVISGGTGSTTFTVDDDGAAFANSTGGPVKVTGIADGVGDYDAVNMRQYRKLEDRVDTAYSGIASVAAITAIPAPVLGKDFSVGFGFGNFENQSAVALGGKAHVGEKKDITLTAGVGYCDNTTTVSAGVGWSF
ncbi:MAG: YadA-like family protein [Sedimentisphaerales bacterium]|nr:YadA-like family protein [Sedimentisphaerales bacterium]